MEMPYWLRRQHAAVAAARQAKTAQSRLIHYEMAGRHSLRAAIAPERGTATAQVSCGARQ